MLPGDGDPLFQVFINPVRLPSPHLPEDQRAAILNSHQAHRGSDAAQ
jgi:hypothetical protein